MSHLTIKVSHIPKIVFTVVFGKFVIKPTLAALKSIVTPTLNTLKNTVQASPLFQGMSNAASGSGGWQLAGAGAGGGTISVAGSGAVAGSGSISLAGAGTVAGGVVTIASGGGGSGDGGSRNRPERTTHSEYRRNNTGRPVGSVMNDIQRARPSIYSSKIMVILL